MLVTFCWEGQYDRKAKHDEFKNIYSFTKDGKPITLVPLTPQQTYEDQFKVKSEREKRMREKTKIDLSQQESKRENC